MISNYRILVTGANGFIGKNLIVRLNELSNINVSTFVRGDDPDLLPHLVAQVDAIVHLAGENRPHDPSAFTEVNTELTSKLCHAVKNEFEEVGRHVPFLFTSSIQAEQNNPYGCSKLAAEAAIHELAKETDNPCVIFRLPGVFGKWCKPNYNSVVATFCHNVALNLPTQVNDPSVSIRLVYIDDVIAAFLEFLDKPTFGCVHAKVEPEYKINLGELENQIRTLGGIHSTLMLEKVGSGFMRALYATYVSYLPKDKFLYEVPQYVDRRGVFVEVLKTKDSGQFSYFTAHPGVTRGGHYHHTKTEKFVVLKGEALFRFRHLLTNDLVEFRTSASKPQVIDTIPGWSHDITNIGEGEMIVMLWANEIFDQTRPDTIESKV